VFTSKETPAQIGLTGPQVQSRRGSRRIHLGVDWGTSWSKFVFRDYQARGGEQSIVVRFSDAIPEDDYRVPSFVIEESGVLWFGWPAYRRRQNPGAVSYESLKVRLAFPDHFQWQSAACPPGLTVEDMSVLLVTYLLHRAAGAADEYCRRLGYEPRLSMTLGVPMSQLDHCELGSRFVQIAREAFELRHLDLSDGVRIEDAVKALSEARVRVNAKPAPDPRNWVRSEAAAALLWAFYSPQVPAGLYAAIDVGAGTTSASWFRITDRIEDTPAGKVRVKFGMAFFGAACDPPGGDSVTAAIVRDRHGDDALSVRGRENESLGNLSQRAQTELSRICDAMFEVYRTAFRRAYPKHVQQSAWFGASLFLLGGGTQIAQVRRRVSMRAWEHLERDPPIMDLGHPDDLHEMDGTPYEGDPTFLLVAYGLSHLAADVPAVTNPGEISAFRPSVRVREIDHEEIYAK
jgi:hypothetical protein